MMSAPWPEQRCLGCRMYCPTACRTTCRIDFGHLSGTRFGTGLGDLGGAGPRELGRPPRLPKAPLASAGGGRPNRPPSPNEKRVARVVGSVSLGIVEVERVAGRESENSGEGEIQRGQVWCLECKGKMDW